MGYDKRKQVMSKEDLVLQDSDTSSDVSHAELGASCNYNIQDTSNYHRGMRQGGFTEVEI